MILSMPSYRPPSPLVGRNIQPIQQPPNIMTPVHPWSPVTTNIPSFRPSRSESLKIGPMMRPLTGYARQPVVNVRSLQPPPNIMGHFLGSLPVYRRLPITAYMPSYRPPSVGGNIQSKPSNTMRIPSYYHRIIPWGGRTVTFPSMFPNYPPRPTGTRIPIPSFNPLPQGPVNAVSRYPYPQIGQVQVPYRPVLNFQLWRPQYFIGSAASTTG